MGHRQQATDSRPTFLDVFSGGGGMSEGFISAGFVPVAHVDSDSAACFTMRTRTSYHWLKSKGHIEPYADYLRGKINRQQFYSHIPDQVQASVINAEICSATLRGVFQRIDKLLKGRRLDLIIGGPPCQAYSIVGRSRDQNGMKGDKRNYLYKYYAKFLKRYKPRYFVFENVIGLLSAMDDNGDLYFDRMRRLFCQCGYETEYKILSASDYGVLQKRRRVVLVGKRGKGTGFFPEPYKWEPEVKVKDAFCGLPSIQSGGGSVRPCRVGSCRGNWQDDAGIRNEDIPVTWHLARSNNEQDLEIYRIAVNLWNQEKARLKYNQLPCRLKTHQNQRSFTDRFKVVASDKSFSHTIVAHIAKDGHYYIHPDIKQNRSITPREAARLQTFPDDYFFESVSSRGGHTLAFRQIGNAVPVLLARKVADRLKELW